MSKNFRKIKIKAWNILQLVHINIQFIFKLILVWNVAILPIWRNCYFLWWQPSLRCRSVQFDTLSESRPLKDDPNSVWIKLAQKSEDFRFSNYFFVKISSIFIFCLVFVLQNQLYIIPLIKMELHQRIFFKNVYHEPQTKARWSKK